MTTEIIENNKPDLPDSFKPLVRRDLTVTKIEGELIVLDQLNGNVHKLNKTAAYVYQHCDGFSSVRDIQVSIIEHFEVDSDGVLNDVRELIHMLIDNHLLET